MGIGSVISIGAERKIEYQILLNLSFPYKIDIFIYKIKVHFLEVLSK